MSYSFLSSAEHLIFCMIETYTGFVMTNSIPSWINNVVDYRNRLWDERQTAYALKDKKTLKALNSGKE